MKQKKGPERRQPSTGRRFTSLRIMITDPHLKNKLHVAILHGTLIGAVLAIIVGILHMETAILEGLIIAGVGIIWMLVFYLINPDDKEVYGG